MEKLKLESCVLGVGDAVDYLMEIPDDVVDLVITDPSYESLEKHRDHGSTTRLSRSKASSNDWFQIFPNSRLGSLFTEIYRILKPNSHFYIFCDSETMFVMKPIGEKVGFKFWKPIVWDKVRIGMGYHYRCRYEFILFFEKGKRKLKDLSVPDILIASRIVGGYPTEKPVEIVEKLIHQSSDEGGLVCDPFCGSGSVAVAAIKNSRRFTGCDLAEKAIRITEERVRKLSILA